MDSSGVDERPHWTVLLPRSPVFTMCLTQFQASPTSSILPPKKRNDIHLAVALVPNQASHCVIREIQILMLNPSSQRKTTESFTWPLSPVIRQSVSGKLLQDLYNYTAFTLESKGNVTSVGVWPLGHLGLSYIIDGLIFKRRGWIFVTPPTAVDLAPGCLGCIWSPLSLLEPSNSSFIHSLSVCCDCGTVWDTMTIILWVSL